jgi:hypothetical protein
MRWSENYKIIQWYCTNFAPFHVIMATLCNVLRGFGRMLHDESNTLWQMRESCRQPSGK